MITSARPIDLALSAFPRSPRTASTAGGTGKNSCRRPAELIDVDHLDFSKRESFRKSLSRVYTYVFSEQHRGLPLTTASGSVSFRDLSVPPNIVSSQSSDAYTSALAAPVAAEPNIALRDFDERPSSTPAARRPPVEHPHRVREELEPWLAGEQQALVLGGPGTGKSTLLSYLLLDLFSAAPRLQTLAKTWGHRLPVWLPFAYWTRVARTGSKLRTRQGASGLVDVLGRGRSLAPS